ncbi:HDOD domain-containing protein [Paraferrimonas sp. SM1919]|uniref:HDOD domain-containing protein n=1 Tax=Paraferrimonas sp. SM1919 TaxID=2662263 RepID=UPI0013D40D9D|nr:HDOD domain-containing protein [Paraferrimonas sp. SM1919]
MELLTELDIEQQVLDKIRSILKNEEQVVGRREILSDLKAAIVAESTVNSLCDIIAKDPGLAAEMMWRSNSVIRNWSSRTKVRSLKDAVIRLGVINLYRYAFSFYLREKFEHLHQPFKKLVHGYWHLNEQIASESVDALFDIPDNLISPEEVQTLGLFSMFGQIVTLTAAAVVDSEGEVSVPVSLIRSIMNTHQKKLTLMAFSAMGLDPELQMELMVAYEQIPPSQDLSPGVILNRVLRKRKINL